MTAKLGYLYRVFKTVAEAGNISAAAQSLYISQSAISQFDPEQPAGISWASGCFYGHRGVST